MAQGHMIPMVDMARLLAERGARVTLITTPVNAARIRPIIDRVSRSNLPVAFEELPFPCAELGLPEGHENIDLITQHDGFRTFFDALRLLRGPLERYLRACSPRPSCIVADGCNGWTADVARRLRIPRFVFHGPSCFYSLCDYNMMRHGVYERVTDYSERFVVPEVPVRVEVNRAQAPGFFNSPGWETERDESIAAEDTADGVVVNTFAELERPFIECYEKALGKKVWTLGPLCLYNKDAEGMAARGNSAAVDHRRVVAWLDTREPGSVVYVSFGSLALSRQAQLVEIGAALAASQRPFIWVIKSAELVPEMGAWLRDEFEEATRERGLVVKGWSPQLTVLSHRAVGGFVTHCGWNSLLEAIAMGVPVLTWPRFADQFLNERLVVDVLGVGVSIGAKMPTSVLHEDSVALVKREEVERAVERLMDGGEEGEERRRRSKELGEKAKKAMEEGGSSYVNTAELIQSVMLGREGESKDIEDVKEKLVLL
ncbi:UDP-glycosyltransferase 73C6-like [Ananas comosus]|nr:UDP-glycosyltransferase 73C6-like [Ananas comosus]